MDSPHVSTLCIWFTAEARLPRPRLHTLRLSSMSGHGKDEEPAAKRPRKEDHRPKRVIAFCKPTEEPYGKFSNYYRQKQPFTYVVPVGSKKMACLSSEPPGPAHSSRRSRPEKKNRGFRGRHAPHIPQGPFERPLSSAAAPTRPFHNPPFLGAKFSRTWGVKIS